MSRVTINDLRSEVSRLNKNYKKTNKTAVKFDISSAYGGHQVVLKNNKTGGVTQITYGYQTPRETLSDLYVKERIGLNYDVNRYHKSVMDSRKK